MGWSRRWPRIVVVATLVLGALGAPGGRAACRRRTDHCRLRDFSYAGTTAPTADKPQSKLWFHDSRWWGVLFRPSPSGGNCYIHRLGSATQSWVSTGVVADTRSNVRVDALSKGAQLYVASSSPSADANLDRTIKLRRYSYDSGAKTYRLDPGFPVTIGQGGQTEGVVIDRDSRGVVWATFVVNGKVKVTHTNGSDATWVKPYPLPVGAAATVKPEPEGDVSAVVHYGGTKTGILWSNQAVADPATQPTHFYFAIHVDGANDQAWTLTTAASGIRVADDHVHLQALAPGDPAGSLVAAVKTSKIAGTDPLDQLLVLRAGTWTRYTVDTVADDHTRPIVQVDGTNRQVYVFTTSRCCTGGSIFYKRTSLDAIPFPPGKGTPFIKTRATSTSTTRPRRSSGSPAPRASSCWRETTRLTSTRTTTSRSE